MTQKATEQTGETGENAEIVSRLMEVMGVSSISELARSLGVGRSTLSSKISRGGSLLDEAVIAAERSGKSLDYVVLGRGDPELMLVDGTGRPYTWQDPRRKRVAEPDALMMPMELGDGGKLSPDLAPLGFEILPMIGSTGSMISKGKAREGLAVGRIWVEDVLGTEPDGLVVVEVGTESLSSVAAIGDVCIVDTKQTDLRDGTYCLRLNNALCLRNIELRPDNAIALHQDNAPAFTVERKAGRGYGLNVVGRLVWVGHRI